eukprot:10739505-Heterocapsa_arctica.AAC.1
MLFASSKRRRVLLMSSPFDMDPLVAPAAVSRVSMMSIMASTCSGLLNIWPSSMNQASAHGPT